MSKNKLSEADAYVRRCIAGRANLPDALVEVLARDADAYVRRCIAGRANLPDAAAEALARDADAYVRRCIAGRAKPLAVLIDGEWYVDA